MCAACAIAAASAATGTRTWLQNHRIDWLTPRRLRALTVAVIAVAAIVSTVGISGSSVPPAHAPAHHVAP
jgi:hypothetical protein